MSASCLAKMWFQTTKLPLNTSKGLQTWVLKGKPKFRMPYAIGQLSIYRRLICLSSHVIIHRLCSYGSSEQTPWLAGWTCVDFGVVWQAHPVVRRLPPWIGWWHVRPPNTRASQEPASAGAWCCVGAPSTPPTLTRRPQPPQGKQRVRKARRRVTIRRTGSRRKSIS